jgi:hypothetical protein
MEAALNYWIAAADLKGKLQTAGSLRVLCPQIVLAWSEISAAPIKFRFTGE